MTLLSQIGEQYLSLKLVDQLSLGVHLNCDVGTASEVLGCVIHKPLREGCEVEQEDAIRVYAANEDDYTEYVHTQSRLGLLTNQTRRNF